MNIAVLKYEFVSNKPAGISDEWPAETIELGESTTLPGEDWVLMTQAQLTAHKATYQAAYDSYVDSINLEENKAALIRKIDEKTQYLISQGFSFDGQQFSLSEPAQINWLGLKTLQDAITWPMEITTKGDGVYSLSEQNLIYFLGTGKAVIQGHIDSGRDLKIAIIEATTQAELSAVVDER